MPEDTVSIFLKLLFSVTNPFEPWPIFFYKTTWSPRDDSDHITKTCLYNFDPLKPQFYIRVNWGLQGVYIIFLIFTPKHRLWVLVRTACFEQKFENIRIFYLKIFLFWVVKFSIYLNRSVFITTFHISAQNIECWYLLEPPRPGFNEYPQYMFLSR